MHTKTTESGWKKKKMGTKQLILPPSLTLQSNGCCSVSKHVYACCTYTSRWALLLWHPLLSSALVGDDKWQCVHSFGFQGRSLKHFIAKVAHIVASAFVAIRMRCWRWCAEVRSGTMMSAIMGGCKYLRNTKRGLREMYRESTLMPNICAAQCGSFQLA